MSANGERPGDLYNARTTWPELLESHGYTHVYELHTGATAWRRPGKDHGISATTNHLGSDLLYVFSTSTPFESERSYDKFGAYAVLEHDGDLSAASRELRRQGYGDQTSDRADDEPPIGEPLDDDPPPPDDGPRLFRRWTMSELLAEPDEFEWRAKGLIVAGTYGMLAGEQKTLKTHIAQFIDIALAAGVPVFGRFEVAESCPVSTYVGEGGRRPYRRRLERVAAAMGVNLADIPLFPSFDIAPIDSPAFRLTLKRDLDEVQPGHVDIDPYYAFHGSSDPKNLHDEGAALAALSATVVDAGASLKVVNHFNQTGAGRGLNRITMAGGGEWADSWWLVSHRLEPDVRNGRFRLLLEVGSRQWGGNAWDLDLDVGTFDIDAGEFTGDITWTLAPHFEVAAEAGAEDAVIQTLVDEPWTHTKTNLARAAGGNVQHAHRMIERLEHLQRIRKAPVAQPEGNHGRMVRRDRYAMTNEPLPQEQP